MTTEASGAIASDQPSYDVFISYRHADHSSSVHALAKELMSYGLKVFLDVETIKPFSLITTTIERSIRHSQTFIAWYSDIYMHSTACTLEFVRALAYYGLDAPERILIVNPHASLDHIYPISARAALCYSIDQMSTQSIKRLAESIYNHVSSLPSISAAPRATAPHTYGQYPNCASEHLIGFRHKELFTILDAFHASESIDATRKVSSLPVIISGPEGIGKSHCIQSYVTLFCNRYTGGIFYFDAGKNSSFDEALTTLGGQMLDLADEAGWFPKGVMSYISLTNDPRQKLAELRTFCTSKLKGQGSYLWIVENLPERMTKQPNLWRAPTSNGRTLATTVVTPSFPECRQIGLRSLMTAEVESILASECEPGFSVDRLHRLAETTAGYPGQLRILQAKIRTFGVERTCALYEELGVDGTGIEMAYGPLLQSCSDQERTLLSALTAMGPTSIPFAAVEAVLRRLDGGALEREGSADPTSTMERLSALALVTLSSKKGLTVEDPVRRLGHNDYCGLSVAPARRLAMVGLFHTLPSNVRVRLTPNLATLITHARHLLTTVDCDEAAFLIQRIGAFDALIGDHDSEQCCFRSSYEWFKAQHGEAHVDTLEALYELSLCYQNRTLEAEEAQIVDEALTKALTTVGEHSIT